MLGGVCQRQNRIVVVKFVLMRFGVDVFRMGVPGKRETAGLDMLRRSRRKPGQRRSRILNSTATPRRSGRIFAADGLSRLELDVANNRLIARFRGPERGNRPELFLVEIERQANPAVALILLSRNNQSPWRW